MSQGSGGSGTGGGGSTFASDGGFTVADIVGSTTPSIQKAQANLTNALTQVQNNPTDQALLIQMQAALIEFNSIILVASNILSVMRDTIQSILQKLG